MKYYAIRTNDQETINNLINETASVHPIKKLSRYQNDLSINDIVIIKVSGDDAFKSFNYSNSLIALGKIVKLPYNEHVPTGKQQKVYDIDIEIEHILDPISADKLYTYPQTKNSLSIGASTKGMPNQAIGQLNNDKKGEYIIKALLDLNAIPNVICNQSILTRYNILNNYIDKCTINTIQVK
jgi:hypothetical protein